MADDEESVEVFEIEGEDPEVDIDDVFEAADDDAAAVEDSDDDADDEGDGIEIPSGVNPAKDDEDVHLGDDEVEASLDIILKEKLVVEDEVDEDGGVIEVDDRGDGTESVQPRQPDEFVCKSCFLVKNPNQLADAAKGYCRDCV